ncbi:nuclease [Streptomyces triticiradicis]|uniref:Nuclease n=1 Tax=Streptomyces triticiradicis TaxID=2651189 RepID=A0A7J5D907_9ACTN|nr:nuclease [Streptomyces triticiradicis]KAB1984178.1 nuclease [Streptomyces triticiradicis]
MTMLLINGSFQIKGTQPDGDTIHFTPADPNEWGLVGSGGRAVKRDALGRATLRLDAIDALETHYGARRVHQPLQFAHAARDELLSWLGFTDVQQGSNETVTAATPETVPGFIYTSGADIHGRCVALAGRGASGGASGTDVDVDVPMLRATANHHLLTVGLVYPTFYRSLFPSLRAELTAATQQARTAPGQGLWPSDATTTGAKVVALSSITDDVVVLPKLFRRLVDFFQLDTPAVACFPAYLAGVQDRFTVLSTGKRLVGLHHVVEVTNGATVRMTLPPEDLVFDES